MSQIVVGTPYNLEGVGGDYKPGKGDGFTYEYHGTRNAILGLIRIMRIQRPDLSYRWHNEGDGSFRVEFQTPDPIDQAAPVDPPSVWELIGQDVQNDLFDHPVSKRRLNDEQLRAVHKNLGFMEKGINQSATTPLNHSGAALQYLYGRKQQGYMRSEYVLKRSLTVSARSQTARAAITKAYYAVDAVWSKDTLAEYEEIPTDLLFTIAQIPEPDFVAVPSGNDQATTMEFSFAWLKKSPTIAQTSGNRYTISQEWWLDEWNDFTYPFVRVLGEAPQYLSDPEGVG